MAKTAGIRNSTIILVKPDKKMSHGRSKRRLEDSIDMDFRGVVFEDGTVK
jgi:hypothetical protein